VLARRSVARGPEALGEIEVVRRMRPRGDLGILDPRTSLLLFPVAILASGFAGLVLVRLLVRRLRAMELLASRVAEGDLSVRIADRSGDEIGRLAGQLDRMTERLAGARDQLTENELQRRQLFADITHELATPLTSIRGYAETLLDPGVPVSPEERTRYVRGLLDESRRMDLLIRDLFELARLEAGASPLSEEPIDWAALCRNTVDRFEPRFRKAGLTLAWLGPARDAWIMADGRRMEQVLENLLVNALRYVPSGGRVEARLDEATERNPKHRLTLSDDGLGIPEDELPLVFRRFYRSTASARRSEPGAVRDPGGSGLGLAIVREIVERHGGTVHAEARSPQGLVILVELPALARS
jgi:signal transduction histidine kinase